jgi:DNA-binding HxlR family transcriptional regulator
MDINTLVKITCRAWSLNILNLMHSGVPGRQAPLLAASGAGRTAFAASLHHLIQLDLVERNPGHGHPLRPEFRLTAAGIEAAHMASEITKAVSDNSAKRLIQRSWTVPVLALTGDPHRFSAIKTDLVTITDRALSSSLFQLESQDWIRRDIETDARTPYPTYRAVGTGLVINQAVGLSQ